MMNEFLEFNDLPHPSEWDGDQIHYALGSILCNHQFRDLASSMREIIPLKNRIDFANQELDAYNEDDLEFYGEIIYCLDEAKDIMIDYLKEEMEANPYLRRLYQSDGAWDILSQGHMIYHALFFHLQSNEEIDEIIHEALNDQLIDYGLI